MLLLYINNDLRATVVFTSTGFFCTTKHCTVENEIEDLDSLLELWGGDVFFGETTKFVWVD